MGIINTKKWANEHQNEKPRPPDKTLHNLEDTKSYEHLEKTTC